MNNSSHSSPKRIDLSQVPSELEPFLKKWRIEPSNRLTLILVAQWHLLERATCAAEKSAAADEADEEVKAEGRAAAIEFRRKIEEFNRAAFGSDRLPGLLPTITTQLTNIRLDAGTWSRTVSDNLAKSQATTAAANIAIDSATQKIRLQTRIVCIAMIGIISAVIGQVGWSIYSNRQTNSWVSQILDASAGIVTHLAAIEDGANRIPKNVQVGRGEDGRTYYFLENPEHKLVWVTLPPQ